MEQEALNQQSYAAAPRAAGGYYSPAPAPAGGRVMRIIALVLSIISLVLVLIMGAALYDMSSRLNHLTEAAQGGRSDLTMSLNKLEAQAEKTADKLNATQQNMDRLADQLRQNSEQTQQNSAAVADIKTRINKLIDLMK